MYSTYNEGKSVVAERFIGTLKNKIYKHMTLVSQNVYIDKLDDIVNEYNNTYHRTIKMKPIEVRNNAYIDSIKEVNDKNCKFKVGDHVRISKYRNIFAKGYNPNWSEKVLVIKKLKIQFHGHMLLMKKKHEKELQKTNQQIFRIEKIIKRKGYKLYVKWKEYDNSFNSWIDKNSWLWVPNVVKNMNIKVFNLMSRTNETRNIKFHETCKCKCRLDASICNNKQRGNNDKCRKNWLTKEYVMKELFGIQVIVNGNVMNHAMFENI